MHVVHVSNVIFYNISNGYLSSGHKKKCKVSHYAKYQQFTFCPFTLLNKLKAVDELKERLIAV